MPCRTVSVAFFLVTILYPVSAAFAQDAPRGVIDWLNQAAQEAAQPMPEPFNGLGVDGEEGAIDSAAGDPTAVLAPLTPQAIDVAPVAGVVADSAGLISVEDGGFPADLWKGVSADRAGALLRAVRPSALRSVNQLTRAALLTEASAPAAADRDGDFITLRAQALLELGLPADALALLQASGLRTPVAISLQLDAAALIGSDSEACALALRSGALSDLAARRVYCLARTGATQEAALALATGRDLDQIRETDAQLLEALIEPSWAEFARAPDRMEDLTPLRLAALDQIGVARPSDFSRRAPLSMRWADMNEDSPPRDRLTAAEQLEEAAALPTEDLRKLYEAYAPAESGGVWGRVEAWRATREALGSSARVEAAALAYDKASAQGRGGSMARLLAPLIEGVRPTASTDTPEIRRALATAGNYADAAYWFSSPPTIGQLAAAKIAAPQSSAPLGQAQLAALRAKDALGDLAAGQQLGALAAFGLIEQETRFTATREQAFVVAALENEQKAEALFAAIAHLRPGRETRPEPFNAALTALIALGREQEARRIALEALAHRL